jgi:hypothetical protein
VGTDGRGEEKEVMTFVKAAPQILPSEKGGRSFARPKPFCSKPLQVAPDEKQALEGLPRPL